MFFQIVVFDINTLADLGSHSPFYVMWMIFILGGWIPFTYIFLWGLKRGWLIWRQNLFVGRAKHVLLAIDVPKENEQLPKAVENVFAHIQGCSVAIDFFEKWWKGKIQPTFSFEICSHGGYVQFYIRTEERFRDLVEAAVFSQYPDAEINEVDDYAKQFKGLVFPPPTPESMDIFGAEFKLKKPEYLPIRTYIEFEEKLAGEFKDPLGALLESFAKIRPEEQIWFQILASPADSVWKDAGANYIKKVAGLKVAGGQGMLSKVGGAPLTLLHEVLTHGSVLPPPAEKKKDETAMFRMLMLTPDTKAQLEAVSEKINKSGFKMKIRIVYLAPANVKYIPRVYPHIKGALNQYNALGMNGFTPYLRVMTQDDYFWLRWTLNAKKGRILRRYISRSNDGSPRDVLNIEEMATIYHFPIITTKAPLVKKTESRRSEPPSRLPVSGNLPGVGIGEWSRPSVKKTAPAPASAAAPELPEPNFPEPNFPEPALPSVTPAPPGSIPFIEP